MTGTNGRHPLPDPATLAQTLGRLGIATGVQVVAYDQDNGMFASRLWWLLRWLGHDAVAVLDGGFANGSPKQRPTAAGGETRAPRERSPARRARTWSVDVDEVARAVGGRELARLVDARAPERYRGEVEPIDSVAGHIPGAVNDHFMQNLDDDGTFRSPEDLRDAADARSVGDGRPSTSSATAARASPRATTCSRSNTPACPAPSCIRARGASGRAIRRGRSNRPALDRKKGPAT